MVDNILYYIIASNFYTVIKIISILYTFIVVYNMNIILIIYYNTI